MGARENLVTVEGNLTRDPELRFTNTGTAICNIGIACNERWQDRQTQEWKEDVSFFDVAVWQTLGENAAETLTKGDRVIVVGKLKQRSWETDEGDKRSKVEITADSIGPSLRFATAQVVRNEKREPVAAGAGTADEGNF